MRNRFGFLGPVFFYLGSLFMVLALLLLVPLVVCVLYLYRGYEDVSILSYLLPAALAFAVGLLMRSLAKSRRLSTKGAVLVCVLAWILLSLAAALPFVTALGISYLDAYFETVSGFTTSGITMLDGLDDMPRSILFWRAQLQWLRGLGILTFFLMVVGGGGASHSLFSAEAHKIFSRRPVPSLRRTLKILWGIYALFTALIAFLLLLAGAGPFDAAAHALTCIATGGFSPYDASIGHFGEAGYANYVFIEYIIIFGMLLGGINFLVHFRVLTGGLGALWNNLEMRLWWALLCGATLLVWINHRLHAVDAAASGSAFRTSLFQVMSMATGTGYSTEFIGSPFFPSFSRLLFLMFMVIGGCAGSTTGGIKVLRIAVLLKLVKSRIRSAIFGRRATNLMIIDGKSVESDEVQGVSAMFFSWIALLAVGAAITALFAPQYGPLEAASGMFSALGNIGPSYIPAGEMSELHPVVKLTYITGMLAGRLEILPVLMLFSRWTWR